MRVSVLIPQDDPTSSWSPTQLERGICKPADTTHPATFQSPMRGTVTPVVWPIITQPVPHCVKALK
jgi:hypothetical protein